MKKGHMRRERQVRFEGLRCRSFHFHCTVEIVQMTCSDLIPGDHALLVCHVESIQGVGDKHHLLEW